MLGLDAEWLGLLVLAGCYYVAGSFEEPVVQLSWIGMMFMMANVLPVGSAPAHVTQRHKGTKPKKGKGT